MADSFHATTLMEHSDKAAEISGIRAGMLEASMSTVNLGGFLSPLEMRQKKADKDAEFQEAHISDHETFGRIHAVHKSILIMAADPMGE